MHKAEEEVDVKKRRDKLPFLDLNLCFSVQFLASHPCLLSSPAAAAAAAPGHRVCVSAAALRAAPQSGSADHRCARFQTAPK